MDEKITRKDLWRMLNNTDSGLMAHVLEDVLELHGDTDEEVNDYLQDVYRYGCSSGITSLTYHKDCEEFVKTHLTEILDIYNETREFSSGIPEELTVDYLAWMAYEYIVNMILTGEPVEDFHM